MKLRSSSLRFLLLVTLLTAVFAGCKGAPRSSDSAGDGSGSISDSDINQELSDSDSGRAMGLQTVYYPYDSSNLDGEAKKVLKQNAAILKDKKSVKIQIEGHCDDRGGIQYNIALGERRAKIAKAYLVDHGVESGRVTTISYGKEKPIDPGHNEEAWAKNRRSNFRVTEK